MDCPEGTNKKLWSILNSVVRELEKISSQAWYLSQDEKDTCGAIGHAFADYSDESLIKQIEMRASQIEERKRYIAGLHGGAEGHCRVTEMQADAIYQRYCGKR